MKVRVHNTSVVGAVEVVSLAVGANGRVYGGYTGAKDHLFFEYDPETDVSRDLGSRIVSGTQLRQKNGDPIEQKIHHALSSLPDGRIVGGTGQNTGVSLCHRKVNEDEGGHIFVYDPATEQAEDLGIPVPHMWVFCTTVSPDGRALYGMTYLHNDFFAVSLATGELLFADQVHGGVWGDGACCHSIVCDGVVYGSCGDGYIFTYEPGTRKLTETDTRLPGDDDRRIDSLTMGDDGLIYGGTWETGAFFSLEPGTLTLRELCRPNDGPRLPALVPHEGRIYGAAGGGSQYGTRGAFLFEYDPAGGEYRELGPIVEEETGIEAQRIHAMVVGPDGTFYAGETGSTVRATDPETGEIQVGMNPYLYIIQP